MVKPDKYVVSTTTSQTLVHRQAESYGDLKQIQVLNTKLNDDTCKRLQDTLNSEALAAADRLQAAKDNSVGT